MMNAWPTLILVGKAQILPGDFCWGREPGQSPVSATAVEWYNHFTPLVALLSKNGRATHPTTSY